jgi:F420H(2)-dependent quinone reductase
VAERRLHLGICCAQFVSELVAERGEHDPAAGPLKKRRPDLPFQRGDQAADPGLDTRSHCAARPKCSSPATARNASACAVRRILAVGSGLILGRMGGHPLLILTTTGRRTGQPHSTPVIGIPSGTDWLVVASNGGAATQPLWLRNIAASPEVTVRRGTRTEPFHARILPAQERSQRWPELVQAYPSYAKMQAKTDRELPVVLLARPS